MQLKERFIMLVIAIICYFLTKLSFKKMKKVFKDRQFKKGLLWILGVFILGSTTVSATIGVIIPSVLEEAKEVDKESTRKKAKEISKKTSETSINKNEEKTRSTEIKSQTSTLKTTASHYIKQKKRVTSKETTSSTTSSTRQSVARKITKLKESKIKKELKPQRLKSLPQFKGQPYIKINNNNPIFVSKDKTTHSFEKYSPLDSLGRVGVAYANLSSQTMSTEDRGAIGHIKPTGWHTVRYSNVDGKYLYNRCHLIGYQLSAENDNARNLMTGTRYLNVNGMLPFENMVADYIEETGNHVLYRVTPYFKGNELVARGVQIEAESVEDKGAGISFNVYCFNAQPGVKINYSTGNSQLTDPNAHELSSRINTQHRTTTQSKALPNKNYQSSEAISHYQSKTNGGTVIRGNSRSKIYHCPGQRDYENMADSKDLVIFSSPEEAEAKGYRMAKR